MALAVWQNMSCHAKSMELPLDFQESPTMFGIFRISLAFLSLSHTLSVSHSWFLHLSRCLHVYFHLFVIVIIAMSAVSTKIQIKFHRARFSTHKITYHNIRAMVAHSLSIHIAPLPRKYNKCAQSPKLLIKIFIQLKSLQSMNGCLDTLG